MSVKGTAITIPLLVWDFGNNCGKTGQEANLTLRATGDSTEFTPSLPAIDEIDATNRKGEYWVTLIAAENNYDVVSVGGILTVAVTDCEVIPTKWVNESADLVKIAGHSIIGTGTLVPDAFEKMFNVSSPVLTAQSVNQTADVKTVTDIISSSKIAAQVKGIDADVITASSLNTDAVSEITAAIWAKIVDGTITFEKMSKLMIAFIAGNYTWDGSVMTVKDQSGATLFTMTIADASGTGAIS